MGFDPATICQWRSVLDPKRGNDEKQYSRMIHCRINIGIEAVLTGCDLAPSGLRHLISETYFYNGWMDEVRIWNKALNIDQLRETMNQEIKDNVRL